MNENNNIVPGKGAATGSLVCGIISVVFGFISIFLGVLIWPEIVAIVLGIIGLVLSASAKKAGFKGGAATGGFVLSLIGLVFGGITFVSCGLCAAAAGGASGCAGCAAKSAYNSLF